MDWPPIQGEVVILQVSSCLENQDKLLLGELLGLSTNLTLTFTIQTFKG